MTTRREGAEWLAMAYGKGYRDGLEAKPPLRCKTLAKWLIGPVFGMCDARALRAAYVLGHSIARENVRAEAVQMEGGE